MTTFNDTLRRLAANTPLAAAQQDTADKKDANRVYLNPLQLFVYNMGARVTSVISGRGSGKTQLISQRTAQCAEIPRASGVFLGASYAQLYKRTMPNLIKSLEQGYHWIEGYHFVRGRPHKSLSFDTPLTKPRTYENCITFRNGNTMYLTSMSVQGSANGLNLAYIIGDEMRYIPISRIREEVLPALRGDVYSHPKWSKTQNPYYLSQTYCSDAAVTQRQAEWEHIMEEDAYSDPDNVSVNDELCQMLADLDSCPPLADLPNFRQRLLYLRCKSRILIRGSSILNAAILGTDFFERMKRQMPPLLFDIQIIGKKKGLSRDGFYSSFDEELHTYLPDPDDENNLIHNRYQKKFVTRGERGQKIEYEAPDLDETAAVNDSSLDTDCLPTHPLIIGIDTNKNINTMIVAQERPMQGTLSAVILRTIYVLNEKRMEDLCLEFHRIYKPRLRIGPSTSPARQVILFYDSTSKQGGAYASRQGEKFRYYNILFDTLTPLGWNVTLIDMGAPMRHDIKYEFVNSVLRGSERVFLRINRINNDYLIAAIENSRLAYKFGAVRKDKSAEKRRTADEEQQLNNAFTDITDALDNILIGLCFHSDGTAHYGTATFGFNGIPVFTPTIG